MNSYQALRDKIQNKKAKICVIGLGYVGLPLAIAFAEENYFVYGFDSDSSRIDRLKRGEKYIIDVDPWSVLALIKSNKFLPTTNEEVLSSSDVVIICVPTPLRKVKIPDISYIVKASKTIAKYLHPAQLVILESTSYPTTTREVVLPILNKAGLKSEKDFFLCFSQERVNPGDKNFPLTKIPKIVGGLTKKSTLLAKNLYSQIIKKLFCATSPEVAESAKLLENTFRLVNIALVNEFAIVAHRLGIDIWEVIAAAKTKPFGFMPFYPGPGVGGHCIPDDPVYFSWKARKIGFKTKMIDLASYMNHFMPKYVINRISGILETKKVFLKDAKILILGVTYKKDVKDLRESPALDIIKLLQNSSAQVDFYDPLVPYLKMHDINLKGIIFGRTNLKDYDCVVIITDHSSVDYKVLQKKARLIFDTRNIYKKNYSNVVKL